MSRKLSGGLVGQPSVGAINVAPTAVVTAAENQDITLSPVGTGSVVVTNNVQLNAQNDLRFADADSSNYVAFQAPATVASNVTWTLPSVDGSANQALITNGSGILTFAAAGPALTDNTTDASTNYLAFTTLTSGSLITARVSTTKLTFQPSTGTLGVDGTVRSLRTENLKTANHTLELADRDRAVTFDSASALTVTVPPNSSVAFPIGSVVYIARLGAGALTLAAGAGVTLTRSGTFAPTEEIYCRKRAENTWVVVDSPQSPGATGGTLTTAEGFTIHSFTPTGAGTFVVG
jgi:hypothetical protein